MIIPEDLKWSATAAQIFETLRNALDLTDRPQLGDYYAVFSDKCMGSFKSPDKKLRAGDWTKSLTFLSEKDITEIVRSRLR